MSAANAEKSAIETKEGCPHATRAFNANGEIIQMACDRWNCDHCRKILAWRWAQEVRYGLALRLDREPWFWTLTLPGWVPTPRRGYEILPQRWDNLRKTLQREMRDFQYCAFVEGQPDRDDMPHFHLITLCPPPRRLKDLAVHAGFGFQADNREVDSREAVAYVCKYASKAALAVPHHFRRVRLSKAWPRLPTPEYPIPVYPLHRGETLSAYLQRMAILLGHPVGVVRDVYLDRSRDVA